jgi:hypothetical protein
MTTVLQMEAANFSETLVITRIYNQHGVIPQKK